MIDNLKQLIKELRGDYLVEGEKEKVEGENNNNNDNDKEGSTSEETKKDQ